MNKWKIIKDDKNAVSQHRCCFYCKRFFCTGYIHPRNRMVCSGILPRWEWLYFLMRDIGAKNTCKKFKMHENFKQR